MHLLFMSLRTLILIYALIARTSLQVPWDLPNKRKKT